MDTQQGDPLPCVTIHFGKDGDQTVEQVPLREQLNLVIEHISHVSITNPLDDLIAHAEALKETVIQRSSVDMPDTLGGAATNIEHDKTLVFTQDDRADYGIVQMLVRVLY